MIIFLLIHNKKNISRDGKFKKILLIFFASFFNYYGFIIRKLYKAKYISVFNECRLSSIQIIISTLIFFYAFGFKMKKHHKASLIIISISFCLLISTDMIFFVYYNYKNIRVPVFQYFITILHYIGYSFNDCIEKYLVDNNYMNPFIILMIEGFFELAMALLSIIWIDPFEGFNKINPRRNKAGFIFVFILYTLLQVIVNIYRIHCNVIYSPMARSLIDYLINPLINIFAFYTFVDIFNYNVTYLIIMEIICIVLSFFGCVFNEYIILYCCGFEHETQDEIADRADDQFRNELDDIDNVSSNNENIDNDDDIRNSHDTINFGNNGLVI